MNSALRTSNKHIIGDKKSLRFRIWEMLPHVCAQNAKIFIETQVQLALAALNMTNTKVCVFFAAPILVLQCVGLNVLTL